MSLVLESLNDHLAAVKKLKSLQQSITSAADSIVSTLKSGGKVILMGNGGSAADAQHIAAELVGRYKMERKAFSAIAITTDSSIVTAVGNDYGATHIFTRQIEAYAKRGDCVIGISTSGNSANVVEAIKVAREFGCKTSALLGGSGGQLKNLVDIPLVVDSKDTPRIQECHILIGHIICDLVERGMTDHGR
ncbi:MAG: D-sedoheptulose 7-phosphate isomerase [Chitinispirillaceae bacterium]|nr:D-sedoheptulose 7-phosphate isomerase [Chitinispirillaceae bacterium]